MPWIYNLCVCDNLIASQLEKQTISLLLFSQAAVESCEEDTLEIERFSHILRLKIATDIIQGFVIVSLITLVSRKSNKYSIQGMGYLLQRSGQKQRFFSDKMKLCLMLEKSLILFGFKSWVQNPKAR